ncbi:hypothetical protein C1645_818490 [Glomus cerebriforme]|uniref:Uncharacterized protein n=1 Tax=Glomus cerebriforme TaxID=658196 RepID=A0A397TGW3_9GLOM|nr:hypothetical protein C1645_818490 [Glomus cerebriforme]
MAIAHFLSTIAAHPRFEEKLRYCSSFKISNENLKNTHHTCFRFDEALETFGMKFIKQHVSGNVIDKKNLKDQIKGAQDERERIDLLMSEYLDNHSISYSKRAIESYKESLWELVHDLVYLQEVLGIERRNTQGRRIAGIVRTKLKDYNQKKVREKRTRIMDQPPEPAQSVMAESSSKRPLDLNEPCPPNIIESQFKKRKTTGRHHTTNNKMEILSVLKVHKDKLPDDAIADIREDLSDVWTIKKVREW